MQTTYKLGDREINRLGFGAMRITGQGIWGPPADREVAIQVLRRAVELGVNFVDTADAYGPEVSEDLIREALYPYDGVVVATKGGMTRSGPNEWSADGRPEHIREAIEGSLRRLEVEQIELYQFHRPDPHIPFLDSVRVFFELRKEGKVRHVGLSNVSPEQLKEALMLGPIASVQNSYSVLNRVSEGVLRLCEEQGIMFIPYFPIGGNTGGLSEQLLHEIAEAHNATTRQIGLAWLLQHSPVIVPIPGTGNLDHLAENMQATDIVLTDNEIQRLDAFAPPSLQ